jgi:hypothetical protein
MEKQSELNIMSVCVCVCILALVIQQAKWIFSVPYYIVMCGLSGPTIFFTLLHKRHNFHKKFI